MELKCQSDALLQLRKLAESRHHSILIDGCTGCGKTYLASRYAAFLNISDFHLINPTVQEIRQSIDACSCLSTDTVLCIENLDTGVPGAAYTLLKFLEEPRSNIYVVVTCRSIAKVPDTIVSRSVCLSTCPPIDLDLIQYAISVDEKTFRKRADCLVWRCMRTFTDVMKFLKMTDDNINYLSELSSKLRTNEPISSLSWMLSKFPDGSELPIEISIRVVLESNRTNTYIQKCGIQCINDVTSSRISTNAALSKFLMEYKYGC